MVELILRSCMNNYSDKLPGCRQPWSPLLKSQTTITDTTAVCAVSVKTLLPLFGFPTETVLIKVLYQHSHSQRYYNYINQHFYKANLHSETCSGHCYFCNVWVSLYTVKPGKSLDELMDRLWVFFNEEWSIVVILGNSNQAVELSKK